MAGVLTAFGWQHLFHLVLTIFVLARCFSLSKVPCYEFPVVKTRGKVLSSFKKLHRVSQSVFGNNAQALESARREINEGYRKNINVTEANSITDLIKFAHEVAYELKVSVVELKPTGPGRYSMLAFLLQATEKEAEGYIILGCRK